MRGRYGSLLAVALSVVPVSAAPPDVPKRVSLQAGQPHPFVVRAAAKFTAVPAFDAGEASLTESASPSPEWRVFTFYSLRPGLFSVTFLTDGERVGSYTTFEVGGQPVPPGPGPTPPGPVPPDPPPGPVTSFRAIIVTERTDTLTAVQTGIIYGKAVETVLGALTTKDALVPGWRRRDKDAPATGDTAAMNRFWAAAKPLVPRTPCIAFEVNGKVTVEPLPATTLETLALINKYAGVK